ncbi:MAG TPA: hypothetical protein VLG76_00470 [Rhabdochlamydiaceae bacterium]|nr:hypothetical protein [Rhabdochlamydiaceae bacterium]
MSRCVFLFGEAEKGELCTPFYCRNLPSLFEKLGNPPEDSQGIHYALQTLLYQKDLIFFRVREEGFYTEDYMRGINLLKNQEVSSGLDAICMPGVGDEEIIEAATPLCQLYKSLLVITEKDLYDYLTLKNLIKPS